MSSWAFPGKFLSQCRARQAQSGWLPDGPHDPLVVGKHRTIGTLVKVCQMSRPRHLHKGLCPPGQCSMGLFHSGISIFITLFLKHTASESKVNMFLKVSLTLQSIELVFSPKSQTTLKRAPHSAGRCQPHKVRETLRSLKNSRL